MRYLITGVAGFIGFHVADRLLSRSDEVLGLDDLNAYYDVRLTEARLARLTGRAGFRFHRVGLREQAALHQAFAAARPEIVIHLAAQAGVRLSISDPHSYADSNLTGFLHVLEGCRATNVRHLVFASSSSVYGGSTAVPYRESHPVAHPVSLYGATKIAGELMAHTYSHLFEIPASGLRLFTVYGPWGRPDMAYYTFTRDILAGRAIRLFNHGRMVRDFTYIDDVVEGLLRVAELPPTPNPAWQKDAPQLGTSDAPWRVLNIGGGHPAALERFVDILETALGCPAVREHVPMQAGDMLATSANVDALEQLTGFRPSIPLEVGIPRFVEWYSSYHGGEDIGRRSVSDAT